MDQDYYNTDEEKHQKGKHLKESDRFAIQIFLKQEWSYREIAKYLNCSPSTIMYEVRRGTGERKGDRGRKPKYSYKRGQKQYEENRKRCRKAHKIKKCKGFIEYLLTKIYTLKWSIDACVGYAKCNNLFPAELIPCTKTVYNEIEASGIANLTILDLPEVVIRHKKKRFKIKNLRKLGKSIEERPQIASERTEFGHWEIDTVVGLRKGKEAVILTIIEKKTAYYIAMKIPHKDSDSVMDAMEVLRDLFGEDKFSEVFKTITSDNGTEFARLSELEEYGTEVYFAHPYSSYERGQNERHNRILRRFIKKGVSIEKFTVDQILYIMDLINGLPRKPFNYSTPEKLFENNLDIIYSLS